MSEHVLSQIVAGVDVSNDRMVITIIGWPFEGEPYVFRSGRYDRVPHLLPGERIQIAPVRLGLKERFLDVRRLPGPADISVCTRTTRRAARRARGRAKAMAREADRRSARSA